MNGIIYCLLGLALTNYGLGIKISTGSQSYSVTGELVCGNQSAANILVKLIDEDDGPDPDDELDRSKTDATGKFTLTGSTTEASTIDPRLKVYHNCNNGINQGISAACDRKWKIRLPTDYINGGVLNIGRVNLELEWLEDDHDCNH